MGLRRLRKRLPCFRGFVPSGSVQDAVDFGEISATPWHRQCRILAVQYLELGETREAMFWTNVGVESLLKQRMEMLAMKSGRSIEDLDPGGAGSYWDDAKTVVAKQFPEIAETIKWPLQVAVPASMFRRIKFFCKHVSLQKDVEEILSKYRNIQQDRNALFHGDVAIPIAPERVKVAIESLGWLVENFQVPH